MSKLNTDTNKKEFWKKFGMSGWQHKVWNSTDEIWNWIDQALQQAYKKGREEEREKISKYLELRFSAEARYEQTNSTYLSVPLEQIYSVLEQLKNTK